MFTQFMVYVFMIYDCFMVLCIVIHVDIDIYVLYIYMDTHVCVCISFRFVSENEIVSDSEREGFRSL